MNLAILGVLKQKLFYTFIHFFFPNSSLTGTAECINLKHVVRFGFYKPLTLNLDFFGDFLPEDVNKSFRQQPRWVFSLSGWSFLDLCTEMLKGCSCLIGPSGRRTRFTGGIPATW